MGQYVSLAFENLALEKRWRIKGIRERIRALELCPHGGGLPDGNEDL